MKAPILPNEQRRLQVLHDHAILDTPPEQEFDDIAKLAAEICETPIAMISLVDESRQWFKSKVGVNMTETPRDSAFCAHALEKNELLMVPDAQQDQRFSDNPLVVSDFGLRFYAGAPLFTATGEALGALCVIDRVPRQLTDKQQNALRVLSKQVMTQLQLRETAQRLSTTLESITDAFFTLNRDWCFTYLNREAEDMLERDRLSLIGKSIWAEFPEAVHGRFYLEYHRAFEQNQTVSFEEFFQPLQKWFEVRAFPSSSGLGVYFRDVTQRRKDQEQLRLLETCVSHINDIVLITEAEPFDEPGPRILYVNDAFVRRTGYSREEAIGRSPRFLQGPSTQRDALKRIHTSLKQWKPVREELINYTKSGEEFWLELEIVPVADATGWFTHWVAIERDITERKHAEAALRASEANMAEAQRIAHFGSWELELRDTANPDSNVLRWSDEMFRIAGFEPGSVQVTNQLFFDLAHPEDHAAIRQAVSTAIVNRQPYSIIHRLVRPDGEQRIVHETAQLFFDPRTEQPIKMIGTAHDITEQIKVESEVRRTTDLLKAVADGTTDALFVKDLQGRYLFFNEAAARFVGRPVEEVLGKDDSSLFPAHDAHFIRESDQRVMDSNQVHTAEEVLTAAGVTRTYMATKAPYRDSQGKIIGVIGISRDITEKKKLEAQFLRAQRVESIGTLAGGIAHDLNNVLAPIMMSIELLKMQETNPFQLNILNTIESSAQRGAEMVRQVLTFARGVEGQQVEVEVSRLLQEITNIGNETFLKNIQVHNDVPEDLWTVLGDPTQLHQVLLNLCVNARDSMPLGGHLSLSAVNVVLDESEAGQNIEAKTGPYIIIRVEDNGTGMSPEIVERIFEPFFTTKELSQGTGLGLSTTLAIVKSHGGFIRVHSELGKGTQFHVYLPAHRSAPAQPDPVSDTQILPRGHGECVLLIDDESAVRQISRQTLESFGYEVLVAGDGAEGVRLYAEHLARVSVVITDMMMPIMDGPTTIQILLQINPKLKIIAASGLNNKVANLGIKQFIPKPYTTETLLKALQEVLAAE